MDGILLNGKGKYAGVNPGGKKYTVNFSPKKRYLLLIVVENITLLGLRRLRPSYVLGSEPLDGIIPSPTCYSLTATIAISQNIQQVPDRQLLRLLRMRYLLISIIQVGFQLVVLGHASKLLDRGLERWKRIHVLQVGADALQFQCRPYEDLMNALCVIAPFSEHVAGGFVCLGGVFGRLGAFPEENLQTSSLEYDAMAWMMKSGEGEKTYRSICRLMRLERRIQLLP